MSNGSKASSPDSRTGAPKIVAFPRDGIAYNQCLYEAAAKLGVQVVDGVWAGRWLNEHVQRGDVAHIHWPSFLYYDAASTRKTYTDLFRFIAFVEMIRRRGARIVWTAHNLYPHDGGRYKLSHRIARHVITSRSALILAHGPTAADIVAKEFGVAPQKIRVIKHGHWIDFHRRIVTAQTARLDLGIAADRYVYSFVGTCKPYKNLELLIETFARLNDDSLLLIAGHFPSKSYRAKIDSMLAKLAPDRWRLKDEFIEDDAIHRYVLAGNALVLPYAEILTSGSAMLGLSFGRPVIAPNAGGLRDMVNSVSGLLYDASNVDGLLDALRNVRLMQFSEDVIIQHARSFDWLDAASALAQLLGN